MILRVAVLMLFPSSFVIVQLVPRSREMKSVRPPRYMTLGLCGDRMNGVFQLNWTTAPGTGAMMFERAGAAGPPAPASSPPPPPPPRPPPRVGLILRESPVAKL